MKTKPSLLLLFLCMGGTVTQAALPTAQVVVPNNLANVEGNSSVILRVKTSHSFAGQNHPPRGA